MTQSLSNLMNSPLALAALILWLLLAFLTVRACRKWAKERNTEKIIYKNHPAVPVKKYKLSDVEPAAVSINISAEAALSPKLSIEQQAQQMSSLRNVWDT